jgi:hypothetical protein
MKKLLIIALFIFSATTAHATWETTGNVVGANDYFGATNGGVLKFKIAGQEIYRIQPDGMRFMKPITTITNDNGQFILNHVTSSGCTGIYGNINKILNICSDGFTFSGGAVNFKTKYYIHDDGSSYLLTATDYTVESNGGEILLPIANANNIGKHYEIINANGGDLPVHSNNGQLIGNYNAESEYQIPAGESVTLVSNGTGWRVLR